MEKNRVFFHKPNLDLFDSMGLTSVDMHFHSRYSDSYTRIQTIIKKAKKKHIGVSITDHNEIAGNIKAQQNMHGVMIVPGLEISCMDGPHFLLYFYDNGEMEEFYNKHIAPKKQGNPYMAIAMKAPELVDITKDYNCLRSAAHPYGYAIANNGLSKCVKKHYVEQSVFDDIDAMEVICGAMNRRLNRKAHNKCIETGKSFTGGTDGHTIFELGNVVTSSYSTDVDSFLTNIQKKKNYVIGRETRLIPKMLPSSNMVTKHMRYALPSIRTQYTMKKSKVKIVPSRIKKKTAVIKDKIKSIRKHKK